ncbi:effector-associated domain 2-containing protein [Streptomyces antimicrobicus]|uniref:Caspase family protein n=1 Tax=Streptomyces antimicrobicus TaxID=2883108 RepID=A0ABS8B9G1_9ACTN|nr:caspase family protein [Streptomyces antimicrobicus]MCB5181262.1 caspase family protein [Streptomyces antimicrobicus]
MSGAGAPAPERTFALVVGIERYAAGSGWDLPGPAGDALRFRSWLLRAGVPERNVLLHLDPLADPGVPYRPADHATLRQLVVSGLQGLRGEALWVWWGGHGVLDRAERMRLFCADATTADKRNLDLESVRRTLAGDALPGFGRQIWIVDACQTFEEEYGFEHTLPSETLPEGRRVQARRQTLLLAATRGQRAANDPGRGTGLFSDSVLAALDTPGGVDGAGPSPWPDPEALFRDVRERVDRLRTQRRTDQLPALWLHGPQRSEHPAPPAAAAQAPPGAAGAGNAAGPPVERLLGALLAYPMMTDPDERQTIVAELGAATRSVERMRRHAKPRVDLIGIVRALSEVPGELWLLYDAVTLLDDDGQRAGALEAAVHACAGPRPAG